MLHAASPLRPLGLLVLTVPLLCSACATSASSSDMTVGPAELLNLPSEQVPRPGSLALEVREVRGGRGTDPMASPQISAPEFADALSQSFRRVGILAPDGASALAVEADLLRLDSPGKTNESPAYITVAYQVFRPGQAEPVFRTTIRSGYVVPMRAAPTGVGRIRVALEGAARKNIAALLGQLAQADLGGG